MSMDPLDLVLALFFELPADAAPTPATFGIRVLNDAEAAAD